VCTANFFLPIDSLSDTVAVRVVFLNAVLQSLPMNMDVLLSNRRQFSAIRPFMTTYCCTDTECCYHDVECRKLFELQDYVK
jgi:hypothetical protein